MAESAEVGLREDLASTYTMSIGSRMLHWGFRGYVKRFVRRNFNAVRVACRDRIEQIGSGPIVCYINHPGWWDPMTGVLLTAEFFPGFRFAAPMDAEALDSYPILNRLGFFPVARDSAEGARTFLRTARRCLADPRSILWVTPAGRFTDVRERVDFQPGLSHLITTEFSGTAIPLAIEYAFWNERQPELLIEFGQPLNTAGLPADRRARNTILEAELHALQDSLAARAIRRSESEFETLCLGRAGVGGLYDATRRMVSWSRGKRFEQRHMRSTPEQQPASPDADHDLPTSRSGAGDET